MNRTYGNEVEDKVENQGPVEEDAQPEEEAEEEEEVMAMPAPDNRELELIKQEIHSMKVGMYEDNRKFKGEQYHKLIGEIQQIAKDVSEVETLAENLRREIIALEDWSNTGRGHYEPDSVKFKAYRSKMVYEVMPGFKGLIITFNAIRSRMDIVQKLIERNKEE